MHIPDGFLSTPVWATTSGATLIYLIAVIQRLKKCLMDKLIPILGVLSAFIFAAQMLNFPVAGGTSGHLIGGFLAAIIVGPAAGSFILAIVLIIQCLIFQDGGLTALGVNIFNMSIIGTFGGYLIYVFFYKLCFRSSKSLLLKNTSWVLGAISSVVLASIACSFELAFSKTVPLKIVLPAMVSIHILIGIGEAIVTVTILNTINKIRPDLIRLRTGHSA